MLDQKTEAIVIEKIHDQMYRGYNLHHMEAFDIIHLGIDKNGIIIAKNLKGQALHSALAFSFASF